MNISGSTKNGMVQLWCMMGVVSSVATVLTQDSHMSAHENFMLVCHYLKIKAQPHIKFPQATGLMNNKQ